LREVSPNEFELEQIRHHHEWENLLQKLKYRSSIERKIELLNTELESTIDYLDSDEEGEVRHIFGDFSQTKLDKVIDKVKYIAQTVGFPFLVQFKNIHNLLF
jgi:dUTPase